VTFRQISSLVNRHVSVHRSQGKIVEVEDEVNHKTVEVWME
jgi:hypothetical protein